MCVRVPRFAAGACVRRPCQCLCGLTFVPPRVCVCVLRQREAMEQLQQLLSRGGMGGGGAAAPGAPVVDTAETVIISSLSLLKMLKHGEWTHGRFVLSDVRHRFPVCVVVHACSTHSAAASTPASPRAMGGCAF